MSIVFANFVVNIFYKEESTIKMNEYEWELENERLNNVLREIQKQYDENCNIKEKIKNDAIETQKELWQDIGAVSIVNGLEQITDFMGFINIMKMQKRSHEVTRKLQEKYKRMLSSPYFGRIDFLEDGEEKAEKYYIGLSNLINDEYDFLIYDWRAPISSMFYDYEIGEASYQCPEGIIKGRLALKRQYKINNGRIEYMFDSSIKIDDEILQDILSKSTDGKMKAIVTTIQREQNKAIRNEEYQSLIVQGPAGSGKTSVALHRIAYLLYKHRDEITSKNIVVFSPNEIFNDYISNVLPQLGEDNMYQTTFKEYMHKALGNELVKEDYCEMMEYILTSRKDQDYKKRINNIKYKSSLEFIDVLKQYVVHIENMDREFKDIVFRGKLIISSNDLRELFYNDYNYIQLSVKKKLKKLKERILFLIEPYRKQRVEEVIEELWDSGEYLDKVEVIHKSIAIVKNEMKDIYNDIDEMTKFNIVDVYRELFENPQFFFRSSNTKFCEKDIDEIRSYTLENLRNRRLNYEDHPLFYI